jgi:DNA/RNA endonuclease G (NUC1)
MCKICMTEKSKEALEKEKLHLEIKDLSRPFLLRPGLWFSLITALVAIGSLVGQNIRSDIKIQRAALEAEQKIHNANKRIVEAEKRENGAKAKAKSANVARQKAIQETEAIRWEAVALSQERLALEEQTELARKGLNEILVKVSNLKATGIEKELIADLEAVATETSEKLGYCTPEEIAVYDKALPLIVEQASIAERRHLPWGLPRINKPSEDYILLHQEWWIGGYDRKLKVPNWVAYRLEGADLTRLRRKDCWRPDPRLGRQDTATREDFVGNNYDRGHLVPRSDMTQSEFAAASVYIYTNIAPQRPMFNRRTWLILEQMVRGWAEHYGHIYVVSGSVFDWNNDGQPDHEDSMKTIGPGNIAVPSHYFKIIVRTESGLPTSILAVLLSNKEETLGFPKKVDTVKSKLLFS